MSLISNNMGSGPFGDTTYTKVFVGGLAWETHKETLKNYFQQFGEILEAVVIFDKNTGRSKGYGFVTFKEAEAARRACVDSSPVIDGRRANCNLASLGVQRSKPSTPQHGYQQGGVGTAFPSTPTQLPHYAIQQGIPCALYGYSPSYTCPTAYYSACGGTSSHYVVYGTVGNGTVSNSNFYPYMQYLDFQYPQHHFQYPIIASSGVHPHPYTPAIPHSQPAGASASTALAAPTVAALAPHYPSQTNSLRPISSI
ncbi:probable RNA-binding protein ARP1 isoform X2 [Ricinus communis]|uniref:probable RNA-binding protein ARP1 isoform X2 n=1 Tax=Ricinus communis TaxID=3988 RepID=UPI0007728CB5|nr:probable RNA-binding protein ARP1 isoform X2 [Ricinus communis]|eukprot:XP_015573928.1 probable RNA-binding protein ARP1 isoform X2 [Ricinus communis]